LPKTRDSQIDPSASDLAEARIGPRSLVVTSPDQLDVCKWELEADTENFIQTIEVR
jgi:leukotriene-A4 hydrolase